MSGPARMEDSTGFEKRLSPQFLWNKVCPAMRLSPYWPQRTAPFGLALKAVWTGGRMDMLASFGRLADCRTMCRPLCFRTIVANLGVHASRTCLFPGRQICCRKWHTCRRCALHHRRQRGQPLRGTKSLAPAGRTFGRTDSLARTGASPKCWPCTL